MELKKIFLYGFLIWAMTYLAATTLAAYSLAETAWAEPVIMLISIALSALAGSWLNQPTNLRVLGYSLSWAVISFVLDVILSVPFTGWELFQTWYYWVGKIAVIAIPLWTNKRELHLHPL